MKTYQLYALISMLFAGVTAVIAKAGLRHVSGDTGLAIRTAFVFIIIWLNVIVIQRTNDFSKLTSQDIIYLGISGVTTSLSWLYYYRAIKIGPVSEIAIIDKTSIVITLLLSFIVLREPFTWKIAVGGILIFAGLYVLSLKS